MPRPVEIFRIPIRGHVIRRPVLARFVRSLVGLCRLWYARESTAMFDRTRNLLLAGLLATVASCKANVQIKTLGDEAPSRRSAASFVHCIEAGTSQCVTQENISGGWDAFYLLQWMADGSPVSVMYALPGELAAHEDPRMVQQRLVGEVERYANAVRGAECDPVDSMQMAPLIDKAAQMAAERLGRLGMLEGSLKVIIEGLAEEAHEGLDGGELVRMDCNYDPYRLYIATRQFDDGVMRVLGMSTMMPTALGGDIPSRDVVDERLHSRALGLDTAPPPLVDGGINAWLPFEVELF